MNARTAALAGAVAGLLGALIFATLHAIIIVPIWDRMTVSLVFAVIVGAAAGWAFVELRTAPTPRAGFAFGAWLFASTIPVTLIAAWLRTTSFFEQHRDVSDAIAFLLALACGAAIGWMRGRSARAAIAMAVAALCLTLAIGGPVPALRNRRAGGIYIAVLFASLGGGALLGLIARRRVTASA